MKKGFTLLELLIVIIILGILAAIALPRYFANIQKAKETEAKSTLSSIRDAELANFSATGAFVGTADFPISVSMSGSPNPDVYLALPVSTNFTYTVPNITAGNACAQANRTGETGDSYYMLIETSEFITCTDADTCACP